MRLAACGVLLADDLKPPPAKPDAKPTTAKPQAALKEDIQDLVFINDGKLLKFRLHVNVDGKPASLAWEAFIDKIFAWYDRNNDKFLSPQEAARIPSPQLFGQGFNLIFNGRGGRGNVNFAEMDTNKDGKVSIEEFRAYARKTGFNPVQVMVMPPSGAAEQLTEAFYKNVNAKNDGKLTKADLAAAWTRLSHLDADEDEIITAQELRAIPVSPYGEQVQVAYSGMIQPQQQIPSPFIALPQVGGIDAAVTTLMAPLRCGETDNGGGNRTAVWSQHSPTSQGFAAEDRSRILESIPHQTAGSGTDRDVGEYLRGCGPADVVRHPTDRRENDPHQWQGGPVRIDRQSRSRRHVADHAAEFPDRMQARGSNNNFDGNAQYYLSQFKMAAGDKKYLEKAQLMDNPQLQFFVNVFEDLDRDGDGKLTITELQDGFNLLEAGGKCQVFLTIVDQGRGIFDLIDANHDNRISRRELLNALKKFDELDRTRTAKSSGANCRRNTASPPARVNQMASTESRLASMGCSRTGRFRPRGRFGSARWTATATARCRSANFSARPRNSSRSIRMVTV